MKMLLAILTASALFPPAAGIACSIFNAERVQVGSHPGVKGICSNNNMPITCILMEGTGIECDGPSGGYTGSDINSLIFSACGCSAEKEREQQLKRQMEQR